MIAWAFFIAVWAGLWAPFFWCCCGPPEPCDVTFTVGGCSATVEGATVTVTQSSVTVATGATDSSGVYATPLPPGGYDYAIAHDGYTTATGTFTVTCPAGAAVTRFLAAAPGYSCAEDVCCPQGGDPPYLIPVDPDEFTLTDPFGSVTLTRIDANNWVGSATRSASESRTCSPCAYTGGASVTVYFLLQKTIGGGCWTLYVGTGQCPACSTELTYSSGGVTYRFYFPSDGSVGTSGSSLSSYAGSYAGGKTTDDHTCGPFSASFEVFFHNGIVMSFATYESPWYVYGDSATFAVSE